MMKMKGADAFERSLKEALEAYEVPYNSADWVQLEQRIDSGRSSAWQSSAALYVLLLGGAISVVTTIYLLMGDPFGNGQGGDALVMLDEEGIELMDEAGDEAVDPVAVTATEEEAPTTTDAGAVRESSASSTSTGNTTTRIRTEKASYRAAKASKPSGAGSTAKVAKTSIDDGDEAAPAAIAIKPSVTEGCPGTAIEFSADNLPENGIFLWNFGDGNFSNQATPTHTFTKAGTFEVMLSHSSLGGGNIRNKPASDRIVIHESPEANFNIRRQDYENTIPSIHFQNQSVGGSKYQWDFGDGSTSTITHPNHVYKKKGTYQVTLTTTNGNGCVDRSERTVVIENDYNLLAPKTFSPDGNGIEDTFIPDALKTLGVKFHMSIFNSTTGVLLYETSDPQRPWNGRVGNKGDLCAPGDYVWLVEMKDGEKLGGTYTGNVSLLR